MITFKVNNHIWQLVFVDPLSKHLMTSQGVYTLGVTDGNVKTIFIADNLSEYMEDKVLRHEITHVFCMEYNYYMPIEIEEVVCDFISLYGSDVIHVADEIIMKLIRRIA